MKILKFVLVLYIFCISLNAQDKPTLSLTFDDPSADNEPNMDWKEKNSRILETLNRNGLKAALFVSGKRINSPEGAEVLQSWSDNGHLICNHTFTHSYFHSKKISLEDYEQDFMGCDTIIRKYFMYTKRFRFPFLKEGDTPEKRDGFRKFLDSLGYKMGYASIDASDWYFDSRIKDTLKADKNADLTPYKEFYLKHLYERAVYYNTLAKELTGRNIKHTLLLHHNLINALFLQDVIDMFREKGWDIVNAEDAFADEVFSIEPDILPAGESIIWAMAKESGRYENSLRYPGEDSEYEEEPFNQFLKSFLK